MARAGSESNRGGKRRIFGEFWRIALYPGFTQPRPSPGPAPKPPAPAPIFLLLSLKFTPLTHSKCIATMLIVEQLDYVIGHQTKVKIFYESCLLATRRTDYAGAIFTDLWGGRGGRGQVADKGIKMQAQGRGEGGGGQAVCEPCAAHAHTTGRLPHSPPHPFPCPPKHLHCS